MKLKARLTLILMMGLAIGGCAMQRAGQQSHPLGQAEAARVESEVRSFAAAVARDVTQKGPIAWSQYFENVPSFFMAVNGKIEFTSGQNAMQSIPMVAQVLKRVELQWGDPLRVDPVSSELAMVAAPWHETLTDTAGHTVTETGYFTGLAEFSHGRWQFRDVHWSAAP